MRHVFRCWSSLAIAAAVLLLPTSSRAAPSFAGLHYDGLFNGYMYYEYYFQPDPNYACSSGNAWHGEQVQFAGSIPFHQVLETYHGVAGFNNFYCQVNLAFPPGWSGYIYFTWAKMNCLDADPSCFEVGNWSTFTGIPND